MKKQCYYVCNALKICLYLTVNQNTVLCLQYGSSGAIVITKLKKNLFGKMCMLVCTVVILQNVQGTLKLILIQYVPNMSCFLEGVRNLRASIMNTHSHGENIFSRFFRRSFLLSISFQCVKQDRQCTDNVTLKRIRVTIVALENQ